MVQHKKVVTMYPVISMIITYDSTRAVTVTRKNDQECYIKMYDLKSFQLTFEEKIGGEEEDYIKIKEVEQNADGSHFAAVYFNDGVFFLRDFGKETRSEKQIKANEVNINAQLQVDNHTMANGDFEDPFINCCFVTDSVVFVSLFLNFEQMHYHFLWDISLMKMLSAPVSLRLDCSKKNFPFRSFYSE